MAVEPSPEKSTNVRTERSPTAAPQPVGAERDPALRAFAEQVAAALDRPRPRLPAAPWYVRAGFSTLGTVAPPLASAWAEQLFLTPSRHPVPAAEADALDRAHAGTLAIDGRRIATWTWGRGPTILLVHGWAGRGGQLHRFVPGLLERGFSVVAFDGPGHGRSEGRTSSLVEHGRTLRAVADALPSPVHGAITHSMGGAAATFALSEGLRLDRAVFIAPPFAAGAWAKTFSRALGLSAGVEEGMRRRIEDRLRVPFAELDMSRLAPRMATPLLVIHDEADKEVAFADGVAITERWPGARLHATSGLGHKRILDDAAVVAEAVAFVTG
jgi:pimeloyl-ACP methyl ester carboxylesterase